MMKGHAEEKNTKAVRSMQGAPEGRGAAEVQAGRGVVGEHPGEDGPLREVVEGAAGGQVAEQQVLQVAHLADLPGRRHAPQPAALRLRGGPGVPKDAATRTSKTRDAPVLY